jgi:hypothetical protein
MRSTPDTKEMITQKKLSTMITIKKPRRKSTQTTKTKTKVKHDVKSKKAHKPAIKSKKIKNGIGCLSNDLEVDITPNGVKTTLPLAEDVKNKGRYYLKYTPESSGFPTIHIAGKINSADIEGSFHPEKVINPTK